MLPASLQTPAAIVRRVQPDVLVKGADWAADAIVGRDTVEARGGRVVRIDVEDAPQDVLEAIGVIDGVSSVATLADGTVRIEVNEEGATTLVLKELVEAGVTAVKTSLPRRLDTRTPFWVRACTCDSSRL